MSDMEREPVSALLPVLLGELGMCRVIFVVIAACDCLSHYALAVEGLSFATAKNPLYLSESRGG
jgi:hypothetical protein